MKVADVWREIAHWIGGATVKELKRRMTHKEWMEWLDYFSRVGRLDPVRLYDRGPALLAWRMDAAMGGQTTIKNYLPFSSEPEGSANVNDIIKEFGGVKRG